MEKQTQTPNADSKKTKTKLAELPFVKKMQEKWKSFLATPFGTKMAKHFDKNGFLYLSFAVPAILFFLVFILQDTYPFGKLSVLVLDLNGQYVYFFEALRKAIYGDASLLYSFCGTLGSEFIGTYAYYLASPLSYLVALFPAGAMTEFLLCLELLKCGLCGLTMAYYLHKTRPLANDLITISVSTMYALSAFAVVMAHNTMWIDALILLPLITYGIERMINYGHFKLFVISFTLALYCNYYIGYMLCFYVFLYFFYYYFFASDRKSSIYATVQDGRNNFVGEKAHFWKSLLRIGAASVISLMIAAAILLPTYYSLTLGKTEFSDTNWSFYWFKEVAGKDPLFKFTPIDFISKLFIASYDSVRRTGFPFVYCGMLTLILVPTYFVSKRVTRRQKIGAGLMLGVLMLLMMIAPLDLVMHGFQEPNWLNYRYSFIFSFIALVLAHRALELLHTVPFKKTVIIASVWAILVVICSFFTKEMFSSSYPRRLTFFIIIPLACLILYEFAHYLLLSGRLNKVARDSMISTLAIIIVIEMFLGALLNTTGLNEDVTFSPKYTRDDGTWLEGYDNFIDRYRPVIEAIQASDDSFYRMEKEHLRKYGDNQAFAMRGTTGSTSTLNAKTIAFLKRLGYVSQSNISQHKGGTSVADSLLGIKYLLREKQEFPDNYYLTEYPILVEGNDKASFEYKYADNKYIYSYLNEYALSIGYTSNEAIKDYNITEFYSPFVTMNNMLTVLLGEDHTVTVFKELPYTFDYDSSKINYTNPSYSEDLSNIYGDLIQRKDADGNLMFNSAGDPVYEKANKKYHTFINKNDENGKMVITFTFTTPEGIDPDTEILFKIPTRYTRDCSWEFKAEGGSATLTGSIYNDDDKTACIISLGSMSGGKTGTLTLTVTGDDDKSDPDDLYIAADEMMFCYVDETVFKDTMTRLAKGNFKIEGYTESAFKGSVTATADSTVMFTTIPYEEYWDVYVDGKEVETFMTCAALLSFDLGGEGEHTVEIVYNSQPLYTGIKIALVGLSAFIVWVALDATIFRKKRMAKVTLDYTCLSEGDYQSDEYDHEIKERVEAKRKRQEAANQKKKKKR